MEVFTPRFEPKALPAAAAKKKGVRVCVVGGGGTGAALAYDLALRGFEVTVLEKGELTSGTTGRHHGQLHCGARYAWADPNIAKECYEESLILSAISPACIEYNGGFFVATNPEEAALLPHFIERCADAGIPAREIPPDSARRAEPALSESISAVAEVPDGSFDAFRLPLSFFAAARALGARILPWHEVVGIDVRGGRVTGVQARRLQGGAGRSLRLDCDFLISAAGAWAGRVGALAGLSVPVSPAAGSMAAVKGRLVNRVISRLRPPGDGDILVPQRGLTIIGSTQRFAHSPEGLLPLPEETTFLHAEAGLMAPAFSTMPIYAAWAAARPLAGFAKGQDMDGRSLSRDFAVVDHEDEGIAGMATIVGGKATVLRAMGEKTADFICRKLGVQEPCRTAEFLLPSWREYYRGRNP